MTIWNKYKKIEEISSKENIKTYKAKIEPIIKEIIPRDKNEYDNILYNLQNYKDSIYEIIEENNKIYVILLNDNINLDNINIIKEGYNDNNIPITKNEINRLFLKEKAITEYLEKYNIIFLFHIISEETEYINNIISFYYIN